MEKIQDLVRYFFILEPPCSQQFPCDIRFFDSNIMLSQDYYNSLSQFIKVFYMHYSVWKFVYQCFAILFFPASITTVLLQQNCFFTWLTFTRSTVHHPSFVLKRWGPPFSLFITFTGSNASKEFSPIWISIFTSLPRHISPWILSKYVHFLQLF